jgi:hypothetical protein
VWDHSPFNSVMTWDARLERYTFRIPDPTTAPTLMLPAQGKLVKSTPPPYLQGTVDLPTGTGSWSANKVALPSGAG